MNSRKSPLSDETVDIIRGMIRNNYKNIQIAKKLNIHPSSVSMIKTNKSYKKKRTRYKIEENGCWTWIGAKNKHGYGNTYKKRKSLLAHRVFYEKYKGKIPQGLVIDHLCNNPSCVNPLHLEAVSQAINNRRSSRTKMKESEVKMARYLWKIKKFNAEQLAEIFEISVPHMCCVLCEVVWKNV
jgi:hypothetical protein